MIPIILILAITTAILVTVFDPYDCLDFVICTVLGLLTAFIPALIYIEIQINSNIVEPVEQPEVSETLVNINDTSYPNVNGSIRGKLFYVYGSISTDNSQAFNYYVEQADGSFKLKSAPASDSTIIYTDNTPKVEITSYVCEKGKAIVETWSVAGCKNRPTTYKFYIPEGSIAEEYRIGE